MTIGKIHRLGEYRYLSRSDADGTTRKDWARLGETRIRPDFMIAEGNCDI